MLKLLKRLICVISSPWSLNWFLPNAHYFVEIVIRLHIQWCKGDDCKEDFFIWWIWITSVFALLVFYLCNYLIKSSCTKYTFSFLQVCDLGLLWPEWLRFCLENTYWWLEYNYILYIWLISLSVCRYFWKDTDSVCNGVLDTLLGFVHRLHLPLQYHNEDCLHCLISLHSLSDIF